MTKAEDDLIAFVTARLDDRESNASPHQLRVIKAQRRIVERYAGLLEYAARPYDNPVQAERRRPYLHALDVVLREFAWVDAHHPDYNPEWSGLDSVTQR